MEDQIEAPCNTFPSQISGPSGELVFWAPVRSLYPIFPDGIDKQKIKKLFNKAVLEWADRGACPMDYDSYQVARKSEKGLDKIKQLSFDKGIPFISISDMPLDEEYFEDKYFICYFASKPYKFSENQYFTVGMIGP